MSRRRPGNRLSTHVANRLCPGTGGPFRAPEAGNLLTWPPVPRELIYLTWVSNSLRALRPAWCRPDAQPITVIN